MELQVPHVILCSVSFYKYAVWVSSKHLWSSPLFPPHSLSFFLLFDCSFIFFLSCCAPTIFCVPFLYFRSALGIGSGQAGAVASLLIFSVKTYFFSENSECFFLCFFISRENHKYIFLKSWFSFFVLFWERCKDILRVFFKKNGCDAGKPLSVQVEQLSHPCKKKNQMHSKNVNLFKKQLLFGIAILGTLCCTKVLLLGMEDTWRHSVFSTLKINNIKNVDCNDLTKALWISINFIALKPLSFKSMWF